VAYERAHTVPGADVPDFGGVVEGSCQDFVALGVEADCDHFLVVSLEFLDQPV